MASSSSFSTYLDVTNAKSSTPVDTADGAREAASVLVAAVGGVVDLPGLLQRTMLSPDDLFKAVGHLLEAGAIRMQFENDAFRIEVTASALDALSA
jgi:hypothetical protein